MRYDLISIDVFIAVAEERNLTRAAKRQHLAVSAVSKRIAELEEQVGSALLVRFARGVELTPAGQSLLHYARQLRFVLGQMDEELASYAAGVKGHVRIHAVTSVLAEYLPGDLEGFLHRYPLINFDIEERVGPAVVQAVVEGRADLGIFVTNTPDMGLETRLYRRDELVLVAAREHPLASRKQITFREALAHEFVGPHLDSSLYSLINRETEKLGLGMRTRLRVSSFQCMCRLVASGVGVAVLPSGAIHQFVKAMKLRTIALDEPWANRSLVIGVRQMELLSPTVRSLVEHLEAAH